MATDFGTDVSVYPDLDPAFSPLSGTRVLCEAIAKRLSTPHGALAYAPDYGSDIRAFLNAGLTSSQVGALRAQIEAEVVKEERIQSCVAACSLDTRTQTLNVALTLVADSGPFVLVLGVTSITLSILGTR